MTDKIILDNLQTSKIEDEKILENLEEKTNEELEEETSKMTPEQFKELYENNREFRRKINVLKKWETKFYTNKARAQRKTKRKHQRNSRRKNRKR